MYAPFVILFVILRMVKIYEAPINPSGTSFPLSFRFAATRQRHRLPASVAEPGYLLCPQFPDHLVSNPIRHCLEVRYLCMAPSLAAPYLRPRSNLIPQDTFIPSPPTLIETSMTLVSNRSANMSSGLLLVRAAGSSS